MAYFQQTRFTTARTMHSSAEWTTTCITCRQPVTEATALRVGEIPDWRKVYGYDVDPQHFVVAGRDWGPVHRPCTGRPGGGKSYELEDR